MAPSICNKPFVLLLALIGCAAGACPAESSADSNTQPQKTGDLAFWGELAFWESIKNSQNPADFEAYLATYPKGRFVRLAEIRIEALKGQSPPQPQEQPEQSPARGKVETAGNTAAPPSEGTFRDCDTCPLMVKIPAGKYMMGSEDHRPDERPRHEVRFAAPFAIGAYEVTLAEWDACLREGACRFSPAGAPDSQLPVSNLSWDDAQEYTAWLTKKTGHKYRLPTEAEWEYAASGGRSTIFWWGDTVGKNNANCTDCGSQWDGKGPAPVGSFRPNPFGLYDVHGNLWEWTMDCANRSYKGAPTDGSAWLRGDCFTRILRGGCWNLESEYMRTTRRTDYDRDVRYYLHGLRVARSLP